MTVSAAASYVGVATFGAVLAISVLVYAWLYRRFDYVLPRRATMSFVQHLRELGARVSRVLLAALYWLLVVTTFRFEPARLGSLPWAHAVPDIFNNASARIYLHLAQTSLPGDVRVIVTRPAEAVGAQLQVALFLAVLLTLPALTFELWAFLAPALRPQERRLLSRALPLAALLFAAGAFFAYRLVVPLLLRTLYEFAEPLGAERFLTAGALVGTLATFALLFGLAFELPLVMALLVRFRLTTPATYLRYWRHATLAIFVVAALVTDPTLLSQLIVAAMLLALYWGGVGLSYLARPPPSISAGRPRSSVV